MRWMLVGGASLGALGVALGAFGAHALEGMLSERALGWYDTAVTYHAGHALALLACGLLSALSGLPVASRATEAGSAEARDRGGRGHRCRRDCRIAGIAFALGVVLFSGSLYLMAFTGWTRLGIVTPFGGLALMAGWSFLALAALRLPDALSSGAPDDAHPAPSPSTAAERHPS